METIKEVLNGRLPCSALEQELISECDDRDKHIKELEGKRPCRVCNSGRQRCSESNECYECYRISVLEAQLDAVHELRNNWIDKSTEWRNLQGVGSTYRKCADELLQSLGE